MASSSGNLVWADFGNGVVLLDELGGSCYSFLVNSGCTFTVSSTSGLGAGTILSQFGKHAVLTTSAFGSPATTQITNITI